MTITDLKIHFDRPQYYPGEMVRGNVTVKLDQPKLIQGIKLVIKGETRFQWSDSKSETDHNGNSSSKSVTRSGRENYLRCDINLTESKITLTPGEHTYPFAVLLPTNIPSTFAGNYGGISYYGIARVNRSLFLLDDAVKTFFIVNDPLDLNHFPQLKNPMKQENGKNFCCCCCRSGPLAIVVQLPKTGYSKTESIPITVEVDNGSRVPIENVSAFLCQKIYWKADFTYSKSNNARLKKVTFGEVPRHSSITWSKSLSLLDVQFPRNISKCKFITLSHTLQVSADPCGAHRDLTVEIPLTIGDIPFYDQDRFSPPYAGQLCINPDPPPQLSSTHGPRSN